MSYGICHLSVIPLRKEPSDKAEIGSQLLFGDYITILDKTEDGKWTKVKNAYDGYEGWIDPKQYKPVSKEEFDTFEKGETVLAAEMVLSVSTGDCSIPVFIGTPLPKYKDGIFTIGNKKYSYAGLTVKPQKSADFTSLRKIAFNYLHAPYLWGGKSLFGIDCSGFVQQVFRFSGYQLPRDAYQQAAVGDTVTLENARPGDLAFFDDDKGQIIHVGIVIENNQIIHASGEVRVDTLDSTGIYNIDRSTYSHKLHSIKRIFS